MVFIVHTGAGSFLGNIGVVTLPGGGECKWSFPPRGFGRVGIWVVVASWPIDKSLN